MADHRVDELNLVCFLLSFAAVLNFTNLLLDSLDKFSVSFDLSKQVVSGGTALAEASGLQLTKALKRGRRGFVDKQAYCNEVEGFHYKVSMHG